MVYGNSLYIFQFVDVFDKLFNLSVVEISVVNSFVNEVFCDLNELAGFFDEEFQTRSGSEEAAPDGLVSVGVGVEVAFFEEEVFLGSALADLLDVLGGGTVLKGDVVDVFVGVDVLDDSVPGLEVVIGVLVVEVLPDRVEKDVRGVVLTHLLEVVGQVVAPELHVEDRNDRVPCVALGVEVLRRRVVVILDVGEKFVVVRRLSHEFEGVTFHKSVPFLVVDTREEPGVHAHLGEDGHLRSAVSESVDLPADRGHVLHSESVLYPLVALGHVVDYVFVVRDCFVVHRNPAPHELQLFVFNQLPHLLLLLLVLFHPPFLKKCDFNLLSLFNT